jgi:Protein of unknown function (DUF559)
VLAHAVHAVISYRELRDLGLSGSGIDHRVRTGRLHRRYPEIFAVGRPDLSLDGEFLAAVRACGPRARLSLRSALRKYGLRGGGTFKIDVTAPRSIKPKPGIRLHRPLSLHDADLTELDGIPITTVARTLLDAADPALRIDMGRLIHEATVQGLLDARGCWEVLARHPNAPGARRLDRALREEHPLLRSGLERAALALFSDAGIPTPACNQWIWDGEKLVEVDFLWRRHRLIVEVDGTRYHATRWRRRRDAAKTTALRAQGWTVHRVTDIQLNGAPAHVAATTLGLLNR